MITWIVGNSGAGKTTLAQSIAATRESVVLDADALRAVWPGLTHSIDDRREQNLRLARMARLLAEQGVDVIVASINPIRSVRIECALLLGDVLQRWVYIAGGDERGFPFEPPIAVDRYERRGSGAGAVSEYEAARA